MTLPAAKHHEFGLFEIRVDTGLLYSDNLAHLGLTEGIRLALITAQRLKDL